MPNYLIVLVHFKVLSSLLPSLLFEWIPKPDWHKLYRNRAALHFLFSWAIGQNNQWWGQSVYRPTQRRVVLYGEHCGHSYHSGPSCHSSGLAIRNHRWSAHYEPAPQLLLLPVHTSDGTAAHNGFASFAAPNVWLSQLLLAFERRLSSQCGVRWWQLHWVQPITCQLECQQCQLWDICRF